MSSISAKKFFVNKIYKRKKIAKHAKHITEKSLVALSIIQNGAILERKLARKMGVSVETVKKFLVPIRDEIITWGKKENTVIEPRPPFAEL
jgi:hypothetical protein